MIDLNLAGPQPGLAREEAANDWSGAITDVELTAISDALARTADRWARELLPRGTIVDGDLRCANAAGDPPRKSGSFVVHLRGDHAGCFVEHDPACADRGGPLRTLKVITGLSGQSLLDKARELVGQSPRTPSSKKATGRDFTIEIKHTLARAVPISGTLAETYFLERGISATPDCVDLLFNDNTTHWQKKTGEPALIARFRYPNGTETGGIHRTYLKSDGSWHDGKRMLGPVEGGLVMLAPIDAEGRLGVGEGIELTLAGMQIYGLPGWAAGSASNMKKMGGFIAAYGADRIKYLTIFADRGQAGEAAAQHLARAACNAGVDVVIRLPNGPDDFADDLSKGLAPSEITLPLEPTQEAQVTDMPRTLWPDPAAQIRGSAGAPIKIGGGMLPYAADEAEGRLIARGFPIFQHNDRLVRVARGPVSVAINHQKQVIDATRILDMTNLTMRDYLNQACGFEKYDARAKTYVPTNAPEDVSQLLIDRKGLWCFRVLNAVIHTPVIRPDNSVLCEKGYDEATGLFFDPGDTEFPPVPDHPTCEDAVAAVDVLLAPIAEIPFKTDADRAVALSAILTAIHRPLLDFAPGHVFDAAQARTGKGLTVNYTAIVGTGSPALALLATKNPEETEKSLVAILRTGATLISLDNLVHPLGESGVVNQILTEAVLFPRILGLSETFKVVNRHLLLVNGNNVELQGDLVFRCLRARLDAVTEHPELRTFKTEFPLTVARRERGKLVAAALTILSAFRHAGQPGHGKRPLGGFAAWDREIRGALIWAGQADPVDTQASLTGNDRKRANNELLVHAWFAEQPKQPGRDDRTVPLTLRALAEAATAMTNAYTDTAGIWHPPVPACPRLREIISDVADDRRGGVSAHRLGQMIATIKDQVFDGLRIEEGGRDAERIMTWIVRRVSR